MPSMFRASPWEVIPLEECLGNGMKWMDLRRFHIAFTI